MTEQGQENPAQEDSFLFPEELTIAQSGDYHRQFAARLAEGGDINLDGSAVTRIDTAFIQLLFALQRSLAEAGCSLRWTGVSPAIRQSAELLGMCRHLALPEEI